MRLHQAIARYVNDNPALEKSTRTSYLSIAAGFERARGPS